MKWKICGMRHPKNIDQVALLKPDYMGFIFWGASSRFVEGDTPALPPSIKKTGVFVNASLDYIQDCIQSHGLQAIQLHGHETPDYCACLLQFGVEVIKAFSIDNHFNFEQLVPYDKTCNYYLFDTKGKLPGGNGFTFDWQLLGAYRSNKPFFLSGGIGLEHINAIKSIQKSSLPLYAIDVNSKFEQSPGVKDEALLNTFKENIYEL